jgi:hypothetical protein
MPVVAIVSVVALALGLVNLIVNGSGVAATSAAASVTIGAAPAGRPLPDGYLGLSLEYPAIETYAGTDPSAPDPVFLQLVRNLAPGQRPVLRIGGDSADTTWWPVPGTARPPGVKYALDQNWLDVTRALERALRARAILGVNLEAGNTELAAAEARELIAGGEPGALLALELGNEPELYGEFPWYRTANGTKVKGRGPNYHFGEFLADYAKFAGALPPAPLAGPTTGGPGWAPDLGRFLAAEPRVTLATVHRYPLQRCATSRGSHRYPTIAHLLSADASTELASSFGGEVAVAAARHVPLRIDELNSVSCGAYRSVSQTFASALWALDMLFELDRIGVDGVNIHTFPGAGYELFKPRRVNGRWQASVAPEYYGLLMFAAAAPPGSRLLPVSAGGDASLKTWATIDRDGTVRVTIINKDTSLARRVTVHAPAAGGSATLALLQAPSASARSGVTIAGQSFGSATGTGRLAGAVRATTLAPHRGAYVVELPSAGAALLTIRR